MKNQLALKGMQDALESLQTSYEKVALVPFSDEIPDVSLPPDRLGVVCWGPSFVPRSLQYRYLSPGIWYHPDAFRWSKCREEWSELMLCPDGSVVSFETAVASLSAKTVFMRPDEDTKAFEGGLYSSTKPPKLQSSFNTLIPVVTANARSIMNEWRFVIVDGKIIAASSYRINGEPIAGGYVPQEASDLAIQALERWRPAEVFCLDVGFDGDRLGIVEANCFNASRLYAMDAHKIISGVNEFLTSQRLTDQTEKD